jgi:hypothetical protein
VYAGFEPVELDGGESAFFLAEVFEFVRARIGFPN